MIVDFRIDWCGVDSVCGGNSGSNERSQKFDAIICCDPWINDCIMDFRHEVED